MGILTKYKGIIFLLLSSIIMSAASPVIAKLIDVGSEHLVHGRNPISFCNVLFAGNLIAFFTLALLYHRDINEVNFKKIEAKNWLYIGAGAFFAGFLSPTLFFLGLMFASVINVVLISTLQVPLTLFFGWLFFKERPSFKMLVGSFLTIIGVLVFFLLQTMSVIPTESLKEYPGSLYSFLASIPYVGEICIFFGVLSSIGSTVVGFRAARFFSIAIFNIFRMSLGLMLFFFIVLALFGWSHFADLLSPFLWKWMVLYGGVIVGLRIYFSFLGIQQVTVAEAAICSALVPVASVFFAYLILGEIPGFAQITGGLIILAGIIFALTDKVTNKKSSIVLTKPPGFSGV